MSRNDSAGRISKHTFLVSHDSNELEWNCSILMALQTISIVLFTFASLSVVARTVLRLRYQKRLFVDDAFLFFAEICLCASFGLLYIFVDSAYLEEALIVQPEVVEIPQNPFHQLLSFHAFSTAFTILTYASIFAVKFGFLFLFRVLVRRVRKLVFFWWMAIAITTVVWIVCTVGQVLPCLYFDMRASMFTLGSLISNVALRCYPATSCGQISQLRKVTGISAMAISLDIITDIISEFLFFWAFWLIAHSIS